MPRIQFDVLVPPAHAGKLAEAIQRALDILVRREKLSSASLEAQGPVLIDATVLAELTQTYEDDRGYTADEEGAEVHRFLIDADGVDSYNRLAMGLSRILTPKAELPRDPVALEQQDRFEVPALFPWTVTILR
ncbi:hypothetical protein [Corynebacterium sp. HMSC071B10]|uniref:hypothetical protein n=1 Tax=Corynebacterium sp. HMSC071B10 TaxID=1739494 RepID=UPI0008A5DED0|nr:hypothetical protein [Corynebacterium sp. HMSC071B10]OFP35999.1 hypothetical protein HMPREF2990_07150 [Corynebacterium sp. HMSC071B10]